MKLYGPIALHVSGEEILRQPRSLDRVRRALGGAGSRPKRSARHDRRVRPGTRLALALLVV